MRDCPETSSQHAHKWTLNWSFKFSWLFFAIHCLSGNVSSFLCVGGAEYTFKSPIHESKSSTVNVSYGGKYHYLHPEGHWVISPVYG